MKRIISAILVCVLMMGCVLALVSCGGPKKNPEKAKKALEKADYEVTLLDGDKTGDDKIEAIVSAAKDDDAIVITYFAKKADAKEAFEELEELMGEEEDVVIGRSGKVVWYGTEAAVKAAK